MDIKAAPKGVGTDLFNFTTNIKLNGKVGSGVWALQISDVVSSDEGTLDEWSLQFEHATCEPTQALTKSQRVSLLGF